MAFCLAGVAAFAFPPPAQAASTTISVLQFNVCGKACGQTSTAVAHGIEAAITASKPQPYALTLNEMCRTSYDRLQQDMTAYRGHFATTMAHSCADGSDFGDVVLVRASNPTLIGTWALPRPGGSEPRVMSCLSSTVAGASKPLVTCVTHIDYNASNAPSQTKAVADRAAALAKTNAVVVGGDFNNIPSSWVLNVMYNWRYSGGYGAFVEADSANWSRSTGTATSTYNQTTGCGAWPCPSSSHPANRKIDFVFLSPAGFAGYWASALSTSVSDHRPLLASVIVR